MSDFYRAARVLLWYETGGIADGALHRDPDDPGGTTRWGIAQRYHPGVDVAALDREGALKIYREQYWDRYGIDRLEDQHVATALFLAIVNMNPRDAVRALQRACRAAISAACYRIPSPDLDGLLGPMTVGTANALPGAVVSAALRSEIAREYEERMLADPWKEKWRTGWTARAFLDRLPIDVRDALCPEEDDDA